MAVALRKNECYLAEKECYKGMRESTLEQKIVNYVKEKGGLALKWTSPSRRGVPDRIIFLPGGRLIFAEIKKPDLKDGLSPQQRKVAEMLTRLGFTVWRVNDFEEFKIDLQTVLLSKTR